MYNLILLSQAKYLFTQHFFYYFYFVCIQRTELSDRTGTLTHISKPGKFFIFS